MSETSDSNPSGNTEDPVSPSSCIGGDSLCAEGLDALDGTTPWRNPGILPEKPAGFEYGIKFKNHPKFGDGDEPCGSDAELLRLLRNSDARIDKVYLPGHDRGVPLRSLNCYRPLRKGDFAKHFLRTLKTSGMIGLGAIGAAIYFNDADWSPALIIFGLLFGLIPVFDTLVQWIMYPGKKSPAELKRSLVDGVAFNEWIGAGKRSKFTMWAMVLMFVAVYLAQWNGRGAGPGTEVNDQMARLLPGASPEHIEFMGVSSRGMIHPAMVRDAGEWWRLFTGTLMHADMALVMHIGLNSLALVYLGRFTHRLAHPLMVPIVFVIAAFVGAIASTVFWGERVGLGSLGASGGVIGLLGFLVAMLIARRGVFPYEFRSMMLRNIIIISILGILGAFLVDNAGHAGGFVGGLMVGIIYEILHRSKFDVPTTSAKVTLGVISYAVMFFGLACCLDLFFFGGERLVLHFPRLKW